MTRWPHLPIDFSCAIMAFFSGICLAFRFGTLIFLLNKTSLKTAQLNAPGARHSMIRRAVFKSPLTSPMYPWVSRTTASNESGNQKGNLSYLAGTKKRSDSLIQLIFHKRGARAERMTLVLFF